jgi:hypothetical protein
MAGAAGLDCTVIGKEVQATLGLINLKILLGEPIAQPILASIKLILLRFSFPSVKYQVVPPY